MGLDIRIKQIRAKHFDSEKPLKEMFEDNNAKFVAEFRNVWSLLNMFVLSQKEDEEGKAYRFITRNRVNELQGGNETMRLKEIAKSFEYDKFAYIVEFDF